MQLNSQGKSFFTKKRIISLLIFFLILIASLLLTYLFIFRSLSIIKVEQTILSQFKHPFFFLLLLIILVKPVFYVLSIRIYLPKSSNNFLKTFFQLFILGLQTSFIQLITPFATGSQPYCIYYLSKRGYKVREIGPLIIFVDLIYQIIILLFPLLIGLPILTSTFSSVLTAEQTSFIVFFSCGITLDFLVTLFLIFSGYSRRLQTVTTRFITWFSKKILRKKNADFTDYFKAQIEFRENFIMCFKQWRKLLLVILFMTLNYLSPSIIYYLVLFSVFEDEKLQPYNFFKVIGLFSNAMSANAIIPLPGGVGSQEWLISVSTRSIFFVFGSRSDEISQSSIFVWRVWNSVITAIIGFFVFIIDLYVLIQFNKKWIKT
jgi:uncharacterized membrane protein YbhN (UPF0104 family)